MILSAKQQIYIRRLRSCALSNTPWLQYVCAICVQCVCAICVQYLCNIFVQYVCNGDRVGNVNMVEHQHRQQQQQCIMPPSCPQALTHRIYIRPIHFFSFSYWCSIYMDKNLALEICLLFPIWLVGWHRTSFVRWNGQQNQTEVGSDKQELARAGGQRRSQEKTSPNGGLEVPCQGKTGLTLKVEAEQTNKRIEQRLWTVHGQRNVKTEQNSKFPMDWDPWCCTTLWCYTNPSKYQIT